MLDSRYPYHTAVAVSAVNDQSSHCENIQLTNGFLSNWLVDHSGRLKASLVRINTVLSFDDPKVNVTIYSYCRNMYITWLEHKTH